MHFEAESNSTNYEVKVEEGRNHWALSIRKNDGSWVNYNIDKSDFRIVDKTISLMFKGHSYLIDVQGEGTDYTVYTRGSYRTIKIYNDEMLLHESLKSGSVSGVDDNISAGMPGKIVKVLVKEGQEVKEGEPLLIMAAMKMENEMRANRDVIIKEIHVNDGDSVESGTNLISFE
jgi:acetyl/propionyl-CoA carboxylase alpha subunit